MQKNIRRHAAHANLPPASIMKYADARLACTLHCRQPAPIPYAAVSWDVKCISKELSHKTRH